MVCLLSGKVVSMTLERMRGFGDDMVRERFEAVMVDVWSSEDPESQGYRHDDIFSGTPVTRQGREAARRPSNKAEILA